MVLMFSNQFIYIFFYYKIYIYIFLILFFVFKNFKKNFFIIKYLIDIFYLIY